LPILEEADTDGVGVWPSVSTGSWMLDESRSWLKSKCND